MKVGTLTTWKTRCGIAEYSKNIVGALRKRDDVEVVVLGSLNHGAYDVEAYDTNEFPVFEVEHWSGHNGLDVDFILDQNLDVIHCQYQSMLYNYDKFVELFSKFQGAKVLTYHDNCQPVGFHYELFDKLYSHRMGVGVGDYEVIPFGIQNYQPLIRTFGLGRCRWDIIKDVCDILGYRFEYQFGDKEWKTKDELELWLREADTIALWYDDVGMAGASQAARQAISTRRPVIVNDVTWFQDLPSREHNFKKVRDVYELQAALEDFNDNVYIEENSWNKVVGYMVEDYKEALLVKNPD